MRLALAWRLAVVAWAVMPQALGQDAVAPLAHQRVPRVRIESCSTMDSSKLQQLFEIELSVLGEVRADAARFLLQINCHQHEVQLRLFDPSSVELLSRSLPLPEHDPEREVALAAAELLMALNWIPRISPAGGPTGSLAVGKRVPPVSLQQPPPTSRSRSGWVLLAGGSAVARSLESSSFMMGGATLVGEHHLAVPLFFAAAVSFEEGTSVRRAGAIVATAWSLGGLVGTEASLHPNWSFVAALGLRATLARLAGASSSESVQVGQLTGVVPDLSLQLGPRLVAGWLVVAPHASGGLTLSDWEARITNESAVQFGGFWLGAGLEVGVIWGPGK